MSANFDAGLSRSLGIIGIYTQLATFLTAARAAPHNLLPVLVLYFQCRQEKRDVPEHTRRKLHR